MTTKHACPVPPDDPEKENGPTHRDNDKKDQASENAHRKDSENANDSQVEESGAEAVTLHSIGKDPSEHGASEKAELAAPCDQCLPSQAGNLDEFTGRVVNGKAETKRSHALISLDEMMAEMERKIWEPRLEKQIHFESLPGDSNIDFRLLFFEGRIFVSADEVAKAVNYAWDWELIVPFTAAKILETYDCELIEVPGPEIPADLDGAVEGRYIPLKVGLKYISTAGDLYYDRNELVTLLDEFEEHSSLAARG